MSYGRSECALASLPGSIVVISGWVGRAAVGDTTEALPLQTMTFAAGPTMLAARVGCAAMALPQDYLPCRALVVGGCGRGFSLLATTEVLTAASF